jgi:hypothetical protein
MNFQEAEKSYKDLKAQHANNKLNDQEFESQVGKLKMQDSQGRWWQIGVQTGDWYVHDGQKWSKSKPPAEIAAPPPPSSAPAPAVTEPLTSADTAPAANANKSQRAKVAPTQLFSAKPAGRNGGGLPMPVLIGIIAVVAIIGIAVLVGGYFVFFGNPTAQATRTPTRLAVQPSPQVAATITIAKPTDVPTPVIPPTAIVTTTITPTVAAGAPTPTRRPATVVTKPTAVPTKPGPSATPPPPPGVYVTKVETDPAAPTFDDIIGFKVTMFNNSGQFHQYDWRVKIYNCPDQGACSIDDLRKSMGETKSVKGDIVDGRAVLVSPASWKGGKGTCKYIAVPHYTDPVTGNLTPFMTTAGKPMYYEFSLCR